MLSSVSYPAAQYFTLYPIKGKIFYMLLNITCIIWFFLQVWFEKFLILRRIQRETSTNVQRFIYKLPVILSDYTEPFIFSTDFKKNTEITNFIKIRPVAAEMFHADKRPDIQAQRIL